ncbi:MAG: energy-coupling factor transporter transmembrane protein EcfT, partial [Eubacterium sp.]|nr:energy-coupling factor transporter transmembrane protein EcfT [Eubacterium sp.]
PITEGAAMSLAIAFDFLPQLGREMEGLKAAAISRGAMLEDGNILERIRDYLPLLIPLFRKTIRHAGELGDAMDLRAYDAGKKRTRMEPLSFKQRDKAALFLLFLYGAVIIALKILL